MPHLPLLSAVLLCMCCAFPPAATAQDFVQVAGVSYDAEIPTPAEVLGHELGERPVRHDMMVQYLREVASLSDRLTIETLGYSIEGRPIEFLVATAPQNQARIDEIRAQQVARTGPGQDAPITDDMPVVTWLGFGVHGAEAAAMDTALPVAYHLAAAQGDDITRLLDESVILITAVLNPDGHAKRISRTLKFQSNVPVTDPDHAGHDLWAYQRANHYWFDLNRQWLLVNQHEPRLWVPQWHQWKPNVSADFHEMGTTSARPATYHFSPGIPESTHPLIPDQGRALLDRLADVQARALDRDARLYFVEESFPDYYLGTGSTYPQVNGSLGILFEAGTAGAGRLDTDLGARTYADNIRLHFTTALSTIEGAQALREDLLSYQRSFFHEAPEQARAEERRAFVFTSPDRSRLAHFLEILQIHDVETYELADDVTTGGTTFRPGEAYVVPLAQAQYRMVRGLFDRVTDFQQEIFYDVSGWTMPLAFNLDHATLDRSSYRSGLLGASATPTFPEAEAPDEAPYGYVFAWTDYYAPRALHRLMEANVRTRVAMQPFTLRTTRGTVDLDRGAIFVPLEDQPMSRERVHELVSTISEKEGLTVHAATSGRTASEGRDLGAGNSFKTLAQPRVLLLFDDGIQHFDAGHLWHLLDERMEMPVALKQKDRVVEIDWPNYTHLILPGGIDVGLSDEATARLPHWIADGGTLIALRQGAAWAEETILERAAPDTTAIGFESGERHDYNEMPLREAEDAVGGAILAGDVDGSHPLGFGYPNRFVASHRATPVVLTAPESPFATVVQYQDADPLLSGYLSDRRQMQLAGTPMMVAERLGSGSVVLMTDNPAFRGTYLGTNRLFINSLFFSLLFDAPRDPNRSSFRP